VRIRIVHARRYLSATSDHLQIESVSPAKAPLPISPTGYLSHFIGPLDLVNAGGPVSFVTAWLERVAASKAYIAAERKRSQGDLFQWAEASAATTAKVRKPPKAKRPAAKANRPSTARKLAHD